MRLEFVLFAVGAVGLGGCIDKNPFFVDTDGSTGSSATGDPGSDSDDPATGSGSSETGECALYEGLTWWEEPEIMAVIDKSGSMVKNFWWDPVAMKEVSRWYTLHRLVGDLIAAKGDKVHTGLVLFPSLQATDAFDFSACVVDPVPAKGLHDGATSEILGLLPPKEAGADAIRGGTPAAEAIALAHEELVAHAMGGPRMIVLITDGAANCATEFMADPVPLFNEYDGSVVDRVTDARLDGIRTLVIGVGVEDKFSDDAVDGVPNDTNPAHELNELAVAGGFPRPVEMGHKFFPAEDPMALGIFLNIIGEQLISCHLPAPEDFPVPPGGPVELEFAERVHAPVADCLGESGWVYSGNDDAFILCGDACAEFKAAGAPEVEVRVQCP